jgi:hypothetical protein
MAAAKWRKRKRQRKQAAPSESERNKRNGEISKISVIMAKRKSAAKMANEKSMAAKKYQ